MNNQPNDMAILESLLPLFNEQLSPLSDVWQNSSKANFELMAQHYHQIYGALVVANVAPLGDLAESLSQLCRRDSEHELDAEQYRIGLVAHHLLHYEWVQYVRTSVYRTALIDKTIEKIQHNLSSNTATTDSKLPSSEIEKYYQDHKNELSKSNDSMGFLPLILEGLESAVFDLDKPKVLISTLQHSKNQLSLRGWLALVAQIEEILQLIKNSINTQSDYDLQQNQIEYLLQKLCDAIYTKMEVLAVDANSPLQQLRLSVTEIIQQFNDFNHQPPHLDQQINAQQQKQSLPSSDSLKSLLELLKKIALPSLYPIVDKLNSLFTQLTTHGIDKISSALADALAESLSAFELLLEYLAQHIFDQPLLSQASLSIERASLLVANMVANPGLIASSAATSQAENQCFDSTTVRYDDQGKSNSSTIISAWQKAKNHVKADDFDTNDEIRQIFIEEAEHSAIALAETLKLWILYPQNLDPLIEIHRHFYTLKGSGRMIGAFSISEISYAIEYLLINVLEGSLAVTEDLVTLVSQAISQLPTLITDFATLQAPHFDPTVIILQSHNLLAGLPLSKGVEERNSSDEKLSILDRFQPVVTLNSNQYSEVKAPYTAEDSQNIGESLTAEQVIKSLDVPDVLEAFLTKALQMPVDTNDADPDIKEIFIEEANEVLADITPHFNQWQQQMSDVSALVEVRRGFHTLKGSGRMVGAYFTAELALAVESLLNKVLENTIEVSGDIKQLISDVLVAYPHMITVFATDTEIDNTPGITSHHYPAISCLWVACAQAYSQQLGDNFSYTDLHQQWLAKADQQQDVKLTKITPTYSDMANTSTITPTTVNLETTNLDAMLETMRSVNDLIADPFMVATAQSNEEQAFCAIFIEEALGLLQEIDDFVSAHRNHTQIEVSDEIVRAFHTLRAASGSNALVAISEVSAMIEQSLEHLQKHDILMSDQHLQALTQSVALIRGYLDAYEQSMLNLFTSTTDSQQDVASLQAMLDDPDERPTQTEPELNIEQLLQLNINSLLDAEWQLVERLQDADTEQVALYIQKMSAQIARLSQQTIEFPKFATILDALAAAYGYLNKHIESAQNNKVQAILLAGHHQLVGLFDSLAGGMSFKTDQQVIDNLWAIKTVADSNNDEEALTVSDFDGDTDPDSKLSVESLKIADLQLETVDTDAELLEIFLDEARELEDAIVQALTQWQHDITDTAPLKSLERYLHTIKGGARMANIRSIGDLAYAIQSIYKALVTRKLNPSLQWLKVVQVIQQTLSLQLDYVARYQQSFWTPKLIEQLDELVQLEQLPAVVKLILPLLQYEQSKDEHLVQIKEVQSPSTETLATLIADSWSDEKPDPDILEVFLEEAKELAYNSQKYLQLFLNDTSSSDAITVLQRDLHTIKGGARMVAANGIADLAHEMETVYEAIATQHRLATELISELLISCHDWLMDAVFILKQRINPPRPTSLISALQEFNELSELSGPVATDSLKYLMNAIAAIPAPKSVRLVEDISQMPSMMGSFIEPERSADTSDEMIRISSGLVERMINLSGESAINRARIDMGMSSLTSSIEEMGVTVQRLADQLRRMETELEAQILSQIDEELIQSEDFDPLEMDQYSSLNQLSKSLSESASDLVDINHTLLEKTRDSENLLLQLSRTQTELQDGLMNSRMVPFLRLKPRLDLILRQTANELNKSVELTIITADDELDRTILERITSPLEHMIRNAIDHGIESPEARLEAHKERTGQITLEVLREGSEVVIHLGDDGRGINIDEVRTEAVARGLIAANDHTLADFDIMQYIFNTGVTTTKQVTQISGRGVGMDVVASEIRQLGGLVSVTSKAGRGTQFTMRIPLTVAVSDALVVRAADRYYAIPLTQIERVVRINPESLYDYYQSDNTTMDIEGADYRVRYLNDVLSGSQFNELMVNTNTSLPVIIVKNSSSQNLALQVDQIAGSRIEVVVKPMGQQLSHLPGISAATIMGNGSVMLILDLIALLRQTPLKPQLSIESAYSTVVTERSKRHPTVLVVDDSVTVRKVTSRFLERQGLSAVVAKDGVDAIEILQELTPDLILLDIEMPRMDGFEVASQVRSNKRLKQIPIIMITSRTGEKHRMRAFETGVNDYMGKPFQENELLEKIQTLLKIQLSG